MWCYQLSALGVTNFIWRRIPPLLEEWGEETPSPASSKSFLPSTDQVRWSNHWNGHRVWVQRLRCMPHRLLGKLVFQFLWFVLPYLLDDWNLTGNVVKLTLHPLDGWSRPKERLKSGSHNQVVNRFEVKMSCWHMARVSLCLFHSSWWWCALEVSNVIH